MKDKYSKVVMTKAAKEVCRAIEIIRTYCDSHDHCSECIFMNAARYNEGCYLRNIPPCNWKSDWKGKI